MGKGKIALTGLPQTSIALIGSAGDFSIKALKAGLEQVAQMQEDEVATGTFANLVCRTNDPFTSSIWDFVLAVSVDTEAFGTYTFTSAIARDIVTLNGLVYTALSGARANDTEFSKDTGDNASATDLAAAITGDGRTGTLNDVTAVSATNVVTATQTVKGTSGNATTIASSDATIVASGATFTGGLDEIDYQLTFNSETSDEITTIGRPAISTRRIIDVILVTNTNPFTVQSLLTVVEFIDSLEDGVAETGSGADGDNTYTNMVLKGNSPFKTYTWTIVKSGNDYTVTPTTTS